MIGALSNDSNEWAINFIRPSKAKERRYGSFPRKSNLGLAKMLAKWGRDLEWVLRER